MTRQYKILILTDHKNHTPEDSIYPMAVKLSRHQMCDHVDVARYQLIIKFLLTIHSRFNKANEDFFFNFTTTKVCVAKVTEKFGQDRNELLKQDRKMDINSYDIIFLRLPRPTSVEFFYFLTKNFPEERIINRPSGILNCGSKKFLLNFPYQCPEMMLCKTIGDVLKFQKQVGTLVLKPFEGSGGKGIIKADNDWVWIDGYKKIAFNDYMPTLKENLQHEPYLAMKYLRNVYQGDKRVVVVNGEIIGASLRRPPKDSWICNASQGATSHKTAPTEDEIAICKAISPTLLEKGIVLYGFDTLVGDDGKRILSEINASCVNGLVQGQATSGVPIIQRAVDGIWKYILTNIPVRN